MSENNTTPPSCVEAEEALLSAVIGYGSLYESVAFVYTTDFFIARHMWIWDAIATIHDRGDAVNNISVALELRDRGQLEDAGGHAYITHLLNTESSSLIENVLGYARIIRHFALRRRLLNVAANIAALALDSQEDIAAIYDQAEAMLQAETHAERENEPQTMKVLMSQHMDDLERRAKDNDAGIASGLTCGLIDLDLLTGGFQPGDLITLGARPGMGKTSLALSIAAGISKKALDNKTPKQILLFSIEMSKEQIVNRLVSMETDITTQNMRQGNLTDAEWSAYMAAYEGLCNQTIIVDDTGNITVQNIARKSSRIARAQPLDMIIVDYLQLAESSEQTESERLKVTLVTKRLKQLAKKLQVPILLLAQLNRGVESRSDKRPTLADLAESGAIEANSDIVMFIYRDDYYNENSERPNQADLIVAKYRNGPTDTITFYFKGSTTQFMNMSRSHVDLVPYSPGNGNGRRS